MIYALQFTFPKAIVLQGSDGVQDRPTAMARFNHFCQELIDSNSQESDFYGVTEGVLLAEEAHERGYETESWVLDAGEAPHERDWIGQESEPMITAYFKTEASAERARSWLQEQFQLPFAPKIESQEEQDWNATWKASFQGIEVSPNLRILPPWHEDWMADTATAFERGIVCINPGAGFGTGTHETTQMCLQILDRCGNEGGRSLVGKTVLDFGSGSGILGITAAKLGGHVTCVEVDRMANENAVDNAKLNQLQAPSSQIRFLESIPEDLKGRVDVLLANILRPILIQFAPQIIACLKPQSELILSGLIESDLESVIRCYQGVGDFKIEKFEKNEWRALWCRRRIQ
jgi:ribosomal protein L11 methyltransferase